LWNRDAIRHAATVLHDCITRLKNESDLIAIIPPEPVAPARRVNQRDIVAA